jgi:hypothetical protein
MNEKKRSAQRMKIKKKTITKKKKKWSFGILDLWNLTMA